MGKRCNSKSLVIVMLLLFLFGIGVTGALAAEPPGLYKYSGKGITAVLTATIVELAGTRVTVEVLTTECDGQSMVFGPFVNRNISDPGVLVNLTADLLLDQFVGNAPPGCFSAAGGEPLRISKVYEFFNAATMEADCRTGFEVPTGAVGAYVELNVPH